MCAVSAVTDYYRDKWPLVDYTYPQPGDWTNTPVVWPNSMPKEVTPITINITLEQWREYQELKRRMEEYDTKTGQPDCIKPEVAEWEKVIVRVLTERGILPAVDAPIMSVNNVM
jgi:hypothetical protein